MVNITNVVLTQPSKSTEYSYAREIPPYRILKPDVLILCADAFVILLPDL